MDEILKIFLKLGVDKTFFYQFIIFVAHFIILRLLLFKRLQFVLEMRENKTTKLQKIAEEKDSKAQELSNTYKDQIDKAHQESQESLHHKKTGIMKTNHDKYKTAEEEVAKEVDQEMSKIKKEMEERQNKVLGSVDELAQTLVNKLA